MAYELNQNESLQAAVTRIHEEQVKEALAAIDRSRQTPDETDEAVHDVRKNLKKTRALLRLARPALGKDYQTWNRHYRNLGRELAPLRDLAARLETLDTLEESTEAALKKSVFQGVRAPLTADLQEHRGKSGPPPSVENTTSDLEKGLRAARRWTYQGEDRQNLAQAISLTYERGRVAFARCSQPGSSPEEFHQWRKRAKYLRYQLRLLEPMWPRPMKALRKELKTLAEDLGDEHNLTVLGQTLAENPARYGDAASVEALRGVIHGRQNTLRSHALSLGERIYAEKPSSFGKRLAGYWERWHQDSLEPGKV